MMEASASAPAMASIQYPYTDYASYQQMFNQQLYQNPEFASQLQAAQQQLNAQYNNYNQESYQQSQQGVANQQSGQYQGQSQYTSGQDMMSPHQQSSQQQSADAQDSVVPDQNGQGGNYMEESAPHPVYGRPQAYQSDPNQFHGRPYGNSPGTIDVHQVLDSFIRQAGLSPQGDHDNAVAGSEVKPVFSVKKLYSYPFYLSASGNKPTSHSGFGRR